MKPIDIARHKHTPLSNPAAANNTAVQPEGEVLPFGDIDLETVQKMIAAFRAIGEERLLDPFNRSPEPLSGT